MSYTHCQGHLLICYAIPSKLVIDSMQALEALKVTEPKPPPATSRRPLRDAVCHLFTHLQGRAVHYLASHCWWLDSNLHAEPSLPSELFQRHSAEVGTSTGSGVNCANPFCNWLALWSEGNFLISLLIMSLVYKMKVIRILHIPLVYREEKLT